MACDLLFLIHGLLSFFFQTCDSVGLLSVLPCYVCKVCMYVLGTK